MGAIFRTRRASVNSAVEPGGGGVTGADQIIGKQSGSGLHGRGGVDAGDLGCAEHQGASAGVVLGMRRAHGLGDDEHARLAQQKGQRHMARRGAVDSGNVGQSTATGRCRLGKLAVPKGAIGHHGHAVLPAPGHDGVFDGALAQVLEHLVAGDATGADHGQRLLQVVHVEVAHGPACPAPAGARTRQRLPPVGADRASAAGGRRVGRCPRPSACAQRRRWHPRARRWRAAARRPGTPRRAVHLGSVDVRQTQIEPAAQCGQGLLAITGFDRPGALANHRHAPPCGAEIVLPHHGGVSMRQ